MTEQATSVAAVIVLAAGAGTRMKSTKSKLLHEIAGRSLLSHAVDAAEHLHPRRMVVVVGHEREQVTAHLTEIAPGALTAVQERQLGTGDAVRCGLAVLESTEGEVVVTMGDVPLLEGETLEALVAQHRATGDGVTILTSELSDPTGYGRIVRDAGGDQVAAIVEQRDCTAEQAAIREINAGIYVFDGGVLRDGLASLTTDNDQSELYLTDVVRYARSAGRGVHTLVLADRWQTEGVNDRVQLATLGRELNRRIVERWMRAGVTVVDPATTWIQASVDLAPDVTLLPNTSLEGATSVASGATIGPDTTLVDVEVGEGATVIRTHGSLSVIGAGASVGPFSFLRPGTELGVKGKIGAFVETKNAVIGDGAKVPHLTYCGDAEIGPGANIGAGTIFANYDGVVKSKTRVGKASFVGSNSVLVAPVQISDGAYVAAGSAVTEDVDPGQLGIARSRQRNIPGWVETRRGDTATWQAAREAIDNEGATEQ
ncbi:bifunctional UDP-N-acetylglucosamine diphosphorylase/glucosamine-1-phosphate N-acetyltransferase GlmU [Propioniciclava sp.]|uniref:bifunctional UDP-N-acetylglucosamine diphosphorylase/glucosamine-1-phosphate N-acetyltransferase GlmU n=1 Tax=Propioniciclava sp. TaxID=2038686 RepID=UPI002633B76C|nr:bifunctional UDP-N-acetylglucosamine diphosphorylase/glucosamine-1-phosphate N-acetyltransferase GlmU [Propioniciclava sp.]